MNDYKLKWNKCLEKIRSNLGEERFQIWFSNVEPKGFDGTTLVLLVPSLFFAEKFEDDFYKILRAALKSEFGPEAKLTYEYYVINSDKDSKIAIESPRRSHVIKNKLEQSIASRPAKEMAQNFDSQLNDALNFENYCVGKSNRLPFTIAEHIANNPQDRNFNPFFLFGNVGVGKTHLIQAIGIRIKERNPNAKVLFTSTRGFMQLYQTATCKGEVPQFIKWFQDKDVLLFDDLQELSGKIGTANDALFPIFNHLHLNNKKLIFTCDRPPMELDGIAERLIDRFKWGITEKLEAPDFELRKMILKFKAKRNGLDLADNIIDLIAAKATSSVRELEGVVMGIYTRSIAENAPITIELAEKVIGHLIKKVERKTINFDMIVDTTAEFFHLNPDAIFSKSRLRDIADARQLIMYLCKKHTGLSSTAIGSKLNRQHATVLHGISAVEDRLQVSKELENIVASIEKSLLG